MNDPDKQNNKSGIEKIPEESRKKILIFLVSFITLMILVGWASTFANTIDLTRDEESAQKFDEIFQQTREAVEQIKEGVSQIKNLSAALPTSTPTSTNTSLGGPTSSPELTNEEIEKLKEKIEEIQNQQ